MWFLCVARHLFLLFKKNRLSIEEKREWDRERGGGGESSHNKNSCKFNSFTIFTVGIRITTRWLNRKGTVVVSRYTESLPQACFFCSAVFGICSIQLVICWKQKKELLLIISNTHVMTFIAYYQCQLIEITIVS